MTPATTPTAVMPPAATAADLLAHWWSRPVAGEVDGWMAWRDVAEGVATALAVTSPGLPEAPAAGEELQALLDEHERLFVGPGHVPCPPYESYWRDDVPLRLRRTLMGPCTEELRSLYAGLGLAVTSSSGELPDHVAVELEALAYALGSPGKESIGQALLAKHLAVWLPTLCRAVAQEATQPFYRQLAALTISWLPVLARLAAPRSG